MPIEIITNFQPRGSGYVVDNQHIKGAYRSVLDDVERLNIPIQNRSIGMLVHEQTSNHDFRLTGGVTNDFWVLQPVLEATVLEVAGTGQTFVHNLGKYPAATIIDTSGNLVLTGRISYTDNTTIVIGFNNFVRGELYLA